MKKLLLAAAFVVFFSLLYDREVGRVPKKNENLSVGASVGRMEG
jgi:hypothetical protein